jgi:hypothetical protein
LSVRPVMIETNHVGEPSNTFSEKPDIL